MVKKKKQTKTKKSLEAKIKQLESKLAKLSSQVAPKPAETAKAPPPPPKPAETAKAPPPPPKPAETKAAPPATLESLIESVPVGNWNERKTKTTGFVPENPRAWARRHATGADAPTQSWSLQKATLTGYTAPSNKYFATRQRLAFHPHDPDKNFLGYGISLGHGVAQTQTQSPPPPPPPQSLPKETASSASSGKSRKEQLADYEKDYLARLDVIYEEEEKVQAEKAQSPASKSQGALPKGF
jgi:BMFP domain-containing protein YqiC